MSNVKKNRVSNKKLKEVKNSAKVQNGLGGAMGFNAGMPGNYYPEGVQLSQLDTLFKNNRWYMLSNNRQLLSELYVEHGLIQTLVDVPVDDGLRGGVEITSKQLAEDELLELQISLDRDDEINTVGQALKWNRLYGGGGILIMTDQDPATPLDLDAIHEDSNLEFRAVDMWELYFDAQQNEGYDPTTSLYDSEYYTYYGESIHKSRVMIMKGLTAPSFIRPRLRGWGFSVIEHLVRSFNQYLKANDLSFEVLDEFKLDIFKIKNLTDTLMDEDGQRKVAERLQMANYQKNYQNALVMDSEDEYDHKQLSFAGLSEVMREIRMQIASDMRMPLTKVFGISAAGFNSGEDDIEVYNGMVESQVRNKCKYDILRVVEIKCQKLFGFIPDDLSVKFKPLRVLNSVDEETVKTAKFNRLLQARSAGEITTFEFRESCNRDQLLSIQLDTSEDKLNDQDPEIEAVVLKTGILPMPSMPNIAATGSESNMKTDKNQTDGANRMDSSNPRLSNRNTDRMAS